MESAPTAFHFENRAGPLAQSRTLGRHPQALAAELEEIAPRANMAEAQHLVDALTHEVDQLRSQLAEIAQQA